MKHRPSRLVRLAVSAALVAIAVPVVGGCANYRGNPTPGLNSLNISRAQNKNRLAIMWDTNMRALRNDGSRFWLLDRPSHLTKQPSPY